MTAGAAAQQQPAMGVFAGSVGARDLRVACPWSVLGASFVEAGAIGFHGLEVDDVGGAADCEALEQSESVSLGRDCEALLVDCEAHVATLYSYRSVSKAIPNYEGGDAARARAPIAAVLGAELARVLEAMRFAARAVDVCVLCGETAARTSRRCDVAAFAACVDVVFRLDCLKD